MRNFLLWAVPLGYLFMANTAISKITGLSTLDAYIVYKIGLAVLLLVGVILTRATKEVGTSLHLNVAVVKYLWLFGVFACVQIAVNGFNVDSTMFGKYLKRDKQRTHTAREVNKMNRSKCSGADQDNLDWCSVSEKIK